MNTLVQVQNVETAIAATDNIGAIRGREVEQASLLIEWLVESKTPVGDFQSAYMLSKFDNDEWPVALNKDGVAILDDDGNTRPAGQKQAQKARKMTNVLVRSGVEVEGSVFDAPVGSFLTTLQYIAPLETTDTGQLRTKNGQAKLDPSKKSAGAGAAQSLVKQGTVEEVTVRKDVKSASPSTTSNGSSPTGFASTGDCLKALHKQLHEVKWEGTKPKTLGDAITQIANVLEIRI